jgi:hypothetical protein
MNRSIESVKFEQEKRKVGFILVYLITLLSTPNGQKFLVLKKPLLFFVLRWRSNILGDQGEAIVLSQILWEP